MVHVAFRVSEQYLLLYSIFKHKRTCKYSSFGSFWRCCKEPLSNSSKRSVNSSNHSKWNPAVLVRFARRWLPSKEILRRWREPELMMPTAGQPSRPGRRLPVLEYTQDILKPLQRLKAITKFIRKTRVERKDLASANSVFCMVGVADNTIPIELHCIVENQRSAFVSERVTKDSIDTILLHGLLANNFAWRNIQKQLSEMTGGFSVAYDRPPFGFSSRPPRASWKDKEYNPYKLDYGVTLTRQVRDYFHLENVVLVGHSAGGTVALMSSLKEPQHMRGLVLISPAVRISYSRTLSSKFLKQYYRSILRTPLLGRRIMRSRLLRYRTPKGMQELLQRNVYHSDVFESQEFVEGYLKPFLLPGWDQALVEMALSFEAFDLIPQLEQLKLPTLVIYGEHDHVIPRQDILDLRDALVDCELHVVQNCGHLPMEEKPGDVLALMKERIRVVKPYVQKLQLINVQKKRTWKTFKVESFCNFDPKRTYETLLELFEEQKGKEENFGELETTCPTTKTTSWAEVSLADRLKARLLKEKYSFASEDWIIDVLHFYEGSMEQAETFLLESYPLDDPNMLLERVEETAKENKSLSCIASYLRDLDALRISSEQQKNALGDKQVYNVVQSIFEKSRKFWNQYLMLGRLASVTKKNYYSERAKEMKHLFELYSSQALLELTRRNSFSSNPVLDLHGFFVEEALFLLESKIRLMKQATTRRPLVIQCITGKGNSSVSGSRLRPAVEKYCKEHCLVYKLEEGAVVIYVGLQR
ncbi:Uncharacterized hydrolase YugF [Galdieria sulphuraria]|nr:Uncharacterized hydrolase YugF [Galdieria sulphuraria]